MVPISAALRASSWKRTDVFEAASLGSLVYDNEIGIKSPGGRTDSQAFKVRSPAQVLWAGWGLRGRDWTLQGPCCQRCGCQPHWQPTQGSRAPSEPVWGPYNQGRPRGWMGTVTEADVAAAPGHRSSRSPCIRGRRVSFAYLLSPDGRLLLFLGTALDVHFCPTLPAKEMFSRRKRNPVMKPRPSVGSLLLPLNQAAGWLLFEITPCLNTSWLTVVAPGKRKTSLHSASHPITRACAWKWQHRPSQHLQQASRHAHNNLPACSSVANFVGGFRKAPCKA